MYLALLIQNYRRGREPRQLKLEDEGPEAWGFRDGDEFEPKTEEEEMDREGREMVAA